MEQGHVKEMESGKSKAEVESLLDLLPPVDFCCAYGSTLHPNNLDKKSMVDCILGVSDPEKWHSENLKMNHNHYASWLAHLGGARLITCVADNIGAGVHFNPFVNLNDKMYKYGVVRMDDLTNDILDWQKFYMCGRLQKPVNILVDNLDLENVNHVNLRAATSAALLLLPSNFTEEDLYAKICSLSYMGDIRMLFAEDRDKVKKIVQGQFNLFQRMYRPFLEEYATKDLLRVSSLGGDAQANIAQDSGHFSASHLVSHLPPSIRSQMAARLGEKRIPMESGKVVREVAFSSKHEAAECMRKIVRNRVMVSSARQAVAGLLTVGVVGGAQYVARKMQKAWKSRT
ncbi:OLC1v1025499C1 [Oldenlandia corymbosa var. corymbosa]|uniref:Phosphatidate cytidylyltransferase, mitochondrial n=1 Tax=Oldenlandia corymbosa var. corymbosa TaxID=529605 RepID=A0AAV1C5G9_OLDCO|nr:OLC1v1025499C1 [Oldenlandia corymbosa var. corymbosa]